MLTAHTRKVRTYGKSNTRIVNDQTLFDRVVSPTKYHSPVRSPGRGARGQDADEDDDEGDEDKEEEDDSEVDFERKQTILRQKIRARPAPLSQKNVNHSIPQPDFGKTKLKTKGTKVVVGGTSPTPKDKQIRTRPQPGRSRPQDQTRVEARGIRSEAQIQARAPICVSISMSSTASPESCSSASSSTSFVSAQSTTLPSTTTATTTSTEALDDLGTNVLETDEETGLDLEPALEGLRSLRVSSGRFEDAPEDDEFHMAMDIGSDLRMAGAVRGSDSGLDSGPDTRSGVVSKALELSGAEVGEDDNIQEGNTTEEETGEQGAEEEVEEEEEEEEVVLPVLRRRTRKNQPRAARASVGSTKMTVTTAVAEASGSASMLSSGSSSLLASDGPRPRRGRGRKVVITPESSQRASSANNQEKLAVEPEEVDDKTRDLIVVLPPRKTTPLRSPSPVGSETDDVELAQTSLEALNLGLSKSSAKSPLQELLDLCGQPSAPEFSAFLSEHVFGLAEEHSLGHQFEEGQSVRDISAASNEFRKVGEASYSEVYALVLNDSPTQGKSKAKPRTKGRAGAGKKKQVDPPTRETGLVVKVIPLIENAKPASSDGGNDEDEDEDEEVACSLVSDVKREIEITRLMSGMGEGFVRCHGAYVVQGSYPEVLLDAWDEFEDQRGSDSVRPGDLPETQLYALIVLENAGVDLESFEFDKTTGWKQAWGAVMQVVKTLAEGEVKARFEHRDLHEGQVLLRPVETSPHDDPADPSNPVFIGYKATMVDFGLSRVDHPISGDRDPYFTLIPEDVFSGVGDQWDVYRAIRDLVDDEFGGDWAGHLPRTNLMWLRHLARVLLYSTRSLKRPRAKPVVKGTTRKPAAAAVSVEPSENVIYYEKLVEFERTLGEVLEGPTMRPRTRQKRTAKGSAAGGTKLTTMVEFVELMRSKEWIL